ncbi:MAG: flagellar type III secretion system pore protein FliP [Sedimentisphaerales bacterium]|nr:flagellar type III secretion system pore protein FliP [Sedimentisphaerales bacterium]
MIYKICKNIFFVIAVFISMNLCYAQNTNSQEQLDLSALGIQTPSLQLDSGASSNTTSNNTLPSISDLKDVIDKSIASEGEGKDWSTPVKLVIIFGGLAILPSLLIMTTSFARIIIVLSFVRRALTTQTIPPTIALIGLAFFLTLYTMSPTFSKINTYSVKPYLAEEIEFTEASNIAISCIKEFMLRQCREADLALFVKMAKVQAPARAMDLNMHIVTPAFIISEFRTSFEIGCLLFIPFLLIDMVIAGILLSAGMMMLPPSMISLPFKLILFILIDGWGLLAKSISLSFN